MFSSVFLSLASHWTHHSPETKVVSFQSLLFPPLSFLSAFAKKLSPRFQSLLNKDRLQYIAQWLISRDGVRGEWKRIHLLIPEVKRSCLLTGKQLHCRAAFWLFIPPEASALPRTSSSWASQIETAALLLRHAEKLHIYFPLTYLFTQPHCARLCLDIRTGDLNTSNWICGDMKITARGSIVYIPLFNFSLTLVILDVHWQQYIYTHSCFPQSVQSPAEYRCCSLLLTSWVALSSYYCQVNP